MPGIKLPCLSNPNPVAGWKSPGGRGGAHSGPEATASSWGEVGRKPEAKPCTGEHEPRRRRGDLGEPAQEGKARHHRQGRHV